MSAELATRVFPHGVRKASDVRGLYVGHSTDGLVDAVTRLLDLMADPEEAEMLGPLVVDEIVIRLLRTAVGPRVAQIGQPKSGVQRIGDACRLDPRAFCAAGHRRRDGCFRPHERVDVSRALQGRDLAESAAIPEGAAAARGTAADAVPESGRERREPPRRLSQPIAVQSRVRAFLWKRTDAEISRECVRRGLLACRQ